MKQWTQLSVHESRLIPANLFCTHAPGFVYDKYEWFSKYIYKKKLFLSYLDLYDKLHHIGILILALEKEKEDLIEDI